MGHSQVGHSRRWRLVLAALAVAGCRDTPAPTSRPAPAPGADGTEAEIRASLERLGPDDARLAERQRDCPVMDGVRLGQMGPPQKVTVNGVPVFVCCEGCVPAALEAPERTLAKVRELTGKQPGQVP